ncbi:MAG: MGMT family protein [Clostridia bacterium]|nr:MGMT family protein [Clostridia bacterium]MBR0188858.1 MGMT family protein [Clostridia bacterium]
MTFFDRVYIAVKQIPYGKVASYGKVAEIAGNKRMARQVGWALHNNPAPEEIPCYRVVFKDGSLSPAFKFGGENVQRALLEKEGIKFDEKGRVKPCFFI